MRPPFALLGGVVNPLSSVNGNDLTQIFTATFGQFMPFALGILVLALALAWGIDTIKSFARGGAPSSGKEN